MYLQRTTVKEAAGLLRRAISVVDDLTALDMARVGGTLSAILKADLEDTCQLCGDESVGGRLKGGAMVGLSCLNESRRNALMRQVSEWLINPQQTPPYLGPSFMPCARSWYPETCHEDATYILDGDNYCHGHYQEALSHGS